MHAGLEGAPRHGAASEVAAESHREDERPTWRPYPDGGWTPPLPKQAADAHAHVVAADRFGDQARHADEADLGDLRLGARGDGVRHRHQLHRAVLNVLHRVAAEDAMRRIDADRL